MIEGASLYSSSRLTKTDPPIAIDEDSRQYIYYDESGKQGNDLIYSNKSFFPLPLGDNVIYVSGRRGAGKSTFCSDYMRYYADITKNKVFLISKHADDESIKMPNRSIRIPIDELMNLQMSELSNSLMVFDDINDATLTAKETSELYKYLVDCIENSRHNNISIVITSHMMADYKKTRPYLYESNAIVFFPNHSNIAQVEKVLRGYYSLSSSQITDLLNLKSRWIYLSTTGKKYVIAGDVMFTYQYHREIRGR